MLTFTQGRVDELEKSTGWRISSADGASVTCEYKRMLQLFLTPTSFLPQATSEPSSISLVYIGDTHPSKPSSLSTEARFFLQLLRVRLQCLLQPQTQLRDVMQLVSNGWKRVEDIKLGISKLSRSYMVEAAILSDEVLAIKSTIFLREMRTKVSVSFDVAVSGAGLDLNLGLCVNAKVIYGEALNETRMGDFLSGKVGVTIDGATETWADGVRELEMRLIARGRK
jgi:hypothetical protein